MTAMGNQQPAPNPAPIIFLDTNAVHYATLALSFGQLHAFDVVGESSADMRAALQVNGITAEGRYVDGARVVRYLCRRFQDDAAEFYFSPVTSLELLCGGLRGECVKRGTSGGAVSLVFAHGGKGGTHLLGTRWLCADTGPAN